MEPLTTSVYTRELFEGLDILDTDYDWKVHPVIHLDLGTCQADSRAELHQSLDYLLEEAASGLEQEKLFTQHSGRSFAYECMQSFSHLSIVFPDLRPNAIQFVLYGMTGFGHSFPYHRPTEIGLSGPFFPLTNSKSMDRFTSTDFHCRPGG